VMFQESLSPCPYPAMNTCSSGAAPTARQRIASTRR
jgi:hypothetical protein